MNTSLAAAPLPPPSRGRALVALAALLWSTSGAFTKVLTRPTPLGLDEPPVMPLQIAFFRALCAGLFLVPTVRRQDIAFRPMIVVMVLCFAVMNATFVSALALGTAANAILLQYTAPMWIYLASVCWLGEPADRRNLTALVIGLLGVGVIIWGGWQEAQLGVVAIALGSGVAYSGVIICLRFLRDLSPRWLTMLNQLFSALVLVPFIYFLDLPTPAQLGMLFAYGAVQMALPYWLVARGLRSVNAQEAGTITLLEPLLNPFWAYLISGEEPSRFTLIGGAFILGALVWRYGPFGQKRA